jgi:hypothetical protein
MASRRSPRSLRKRELQLSRQHKTKAALCYFLRKAHECIVEHLDLPNATGLIQSDDRPLRSTINGIGPRYALADDADDLTKCRFTSVVSFLSRPCDSSAWCWRWRFSAGEEITEQPRRHCMARTPTAGGGRVRRTVVKGILAARTTIVAVLGSHNANSANECVNYCGTAGWIDGCCLRAIGVVRNAATRSTAIS